MTTIFKQLGPYEIVREIGRGGMALVLLANDTRAGRLVALKLVPQGTDREARDILDAEQWGAELQKQFSQISGHVPAVYEYGADEAGYFFVAMEYLDGENLSDVISRGPLPADRAIGITMEVCAFLEAAHRFQAVIRDRQLRSLVHSDLKPRNVRITSGNQVKVLDFGIAKALSLSRKVTRNDFGTMPYLSPERLDSDEVDEYADFWAVGVMLYEMLRGTTPFQAPDTRRLEQLILSRRPPPALSGERPIGLQAIVAKLLGPSPADRYDSARAIREDLERFSSGERTRAEEETWPNRTIDEPPTRRTRTATGVDDEKTRRTRDPGDASIPAGSSGFTEGNAAAPVKDVVTTVQRLIGGRSRRLRRAALLVFVLGFLGNELWVAMAAGRVAQTVSTRELEQLADVWATFDSLSRRSYLRVGTLALERSLTERTSTLADRVIANYRSRLPTVREAHWQMARDSLARAITITGNDDPQLRAALRYCEGHLHRINGEARKARREFAEAQRELTAAVAAFREAAELRPGWPDPFLGLARTFIYGFEDVDRSADALYHALRNGYTQGDRETAQLADGYRTRGNTLVRNARELSGMPQERDYLMRAVEAYRQALNLYSRASSFASVPANTRLTQRSLSQVEQRLKELSEAMTEPGEPVDAGTALPELPSQGAARPEEAISWA
ncbi:MAG: protein kinase domain-containing protein [Vicinamibacterales bacterium]